MAMGISVKDVSPHEFNKTFAAFLKKSGKMQEPEWTDFMKLGRFNELAPYDKDWYYNRAARSFCGRVLPPMHSDCFVSASICRHLYIRSPAGVGAFEKIYGGLKRRGVTPSHFCRANGSVSRRILQSLEAMNLVEKDANGGRRLTSQGRRDLDRIAAQIKSKKPAPVV